MKNLKNNIKMKFPNPIALAAILRESAGPMNIDKRLFHKRNRQNWKRKLKEEHVTAFQH